MHGNTTESSDAQHSNDDLGLDGSLTRRRFIATTGAAVAAAATAGTASAEDSAIDDSETLNFDSDLVQDPYLNGSITVATHESGFSELDYINDNGETVSLMDHGVMIAERADADTAHNPVELMAANITSPEYTAFPRGATWDDDSDTSTDEVAVSSLEATHWSKDVSGSGGSMSISDGDNDSLVVSTSSQTSGDTAIATFDLSTVASDDVTITDGMSRKFLQSVLDVDTLESGVLVEVAIVDSNDNEVVATIDPDGDTSTTKVMHASTGSSKVSQVRVGELEDGQSTTLDDIEQLQIRIKEANAGVTIHGLNLERESIWTFGSQEYVNSDSEVDTQDVENPSGSFSITSLSTLPDTWSDATIRDVVYDVELRASGVPEDQRHVRVMDSPDAYDRPKEIEYVAELIPPSAYELSVSVSNAEDEVQLPSSRYLEASAATAISDIDEWSDVEDSISWTDRTSNYSTVGNTVELLGTVSASDRTAVRVRSLHDEQEISDMTGSSSGSAAVAAGGGGGGGFNWGLTALLGLGGGLLAFFRKNIISALRG